MPEMTTVHNTSCKKMYTRAEVALHKKTDDLWIIVHGRVYDVTKWAETHPGGTELLQTHGGEDASVSRLLLFVLVSFVYTYLLLGVGGCWQVQVISSYSICLIC